MLTSRSRLALKALTTLARHPGQALTRPGLSAGSGVSLAHLDRILVALRRANLVWRERRWNGGYRLARSPDAISVLDVMRAIDGPVASLPCLSRTAYRRCRDCPDEDGCGVRRLLRPVNQAEVEILARTTLDQAAAPAPRSSAYPANPDLPDGCLQNLESGRGDF